MVKCCADCKNCVRLLGNVRYNFYCNLTKTRDRVTGEYDYRSCNVIIDSDECVFRPTIVARMLDYIRSK